MVPMPNKVQIIDMAFLENNYDNDNSPPSLKPSIYAKVE